MIYLFKSCFKRSGFLEKLYKMATLLTERYSEGNEPFQMMARLLEECGEVAKEVHLWENSGIKRMKYGTPVKEDLANEIRQVYIVLAQLLQYYHLEINFENSVEQFLKNFSPEDHRKKQV